MLTLAYVIEEALLQCYLNYSELLGEASPCKETHGRMGLSGPPKSKIFV